MALGITDSNNSQTKNQKEFLEAIFRAPKTNTRVKKRKPSPHIKIIEKYLNDETFNPNFSVDASFPLSAAVTSHGNTWLLQMLLNQGRIEVDFSNDEGRTALSYAAEYQQASVVDILLSEGAKPCSQDNVGRTPLSWASAQRGFEKTNATIIDSLVAAGADINSTDDNMRTPLSWATIKGNEFEVAHLLSVSGINVSLPDDENRTPLSHAAELGHDNIIGTLVKSNADINSVDGRKWTPLMWATMKGRYNTVKHILSIDLIEVNNQDIDGWTALHHAAKLGNDHIMELLIKNGADATYKNREGHTPFWLLLKARQGGEKVDAIWNPSQISNIFRLFPDPDFKDQDERTLLSWAAEYGDWEMVEALLQNNANPNNRDPETHPRNVPHSLNELESRTQSTFRKTPLIWALENRRERAIEMLKSIDKGTLHLLLRESDIIGEKNALEMVHTLINRGYNINQADAEGKTPLHVASTIDNEDFASALILGKANLERQDNSRKTPLQCAFREKRKNIIRVLLDHGADITPIQSVEWLSLGSNKSHYAQITRKGRKQQYSMLPTPAKDNMTWVPRAGEYRLSLHSKQDIYWSRLCHEHHFRRFRSDYVCYGFLNSNSLPEGFIASRMAVSFPSELGINPGRTQSFWGIEWAVNQSTTGFAYGFISTLSTSRVPESISDFCQQFLRELVEEWDKICSKGIQDIEGIRSHQLKLRGRSRRLIDDLARNSLKRAELRRCLQQQVSGLQKAVDDSTTIKIDEKKQLANRIENMKKSVASQLDDMERAIRELLQIELAWVTIGETASMKRLSWVTFIFLPLMFVSSLFGMNVDILQNNPDWRWYILCSTLCLLSTVAIWVSFKFLNIESWSEARRFSPLHKRTVKYKGHADV